jgi:hypothetical protein
MGVIESAPAWRWVESVEILAHGVGIDDMRAGGEAEVEGKPGHVQDCSGEP